MHEKPKIGVLPCEAYENQKIGETLTYPKIRKSGKLFSKISENQGIFFLGKSEKLFCPNSGNWGNFFQKIKNA